MSHWGYPGDGTPPASEKVKSHALGLVLLLAFGLAMLVAFAGCADNTYFNPTQAKARSEQRQEEIEKDKLKQLTRIADAVERLFHEHKPAIVIHLAADVGGIGANQQTPGRFF